MAPRECAARLLKESQDGTVAAVFGPEKSGLTNDDLDLCNTLLTIPTTPGFSSLNLAMAVQVLSYELRVAGFDEIENDHAPASPLATGEELELFYTHLESVLKHSGFLDPENPRYLIRRVRRLIIRAEPDQSEINILRGILSSLEPMLERTRDKKTREQNK
jgi:TrmH family RNA methyltransferase